MRSIRQVVAVALTVWLIAVAWGFAGEKMQVTIERHKPCNLFTPQEPVSFKVYIKGGTPAPKLFACVVDYEGKEVLRRAVSSAPAEGNTTGTGEAMLLDAGALPAGYYTLQIFSESGQEKRPAATATFCVVPFVDRTAKQAREAGSRFGLKVWLLGQPGVWWRKPLVWDVREVADATRRMGLQWTRNGIGPEYTDPQPGVISTQEMVAKYQMNVVLKLEGFSEFCFDTERYGALDAFRKEYPSWAKCSLPKKEPYQQWLKEQLQYAPADQNIFEIWNEPWQWQWKKTLTADDFAKLCQWTREVVRKERPGALIGPNILGGHGENAYDERFIDAGGLAGMDLVAIHPYAASTPEEKGFRQQIRNYHDLLKRKLGRDLPLYTTEYGWSNAPQDPRCVNETEQARRTVRESLMLYAEDVKTLIPHWMGDREHDPKDREHWFGFFHITQEPKPIVAAFATCAKMIDSTRFVGDLNLGSGIGAMLFERDKVYTLALWTEQNSKSLTLDVQSSQVRMVSFTGAEKSVLPVDGKLTLQVGPDVTYLSGVGKGLQASVRKPEEPLIADLWRERDGRYTAPRLLQPPVVDGVLSEWPSLPTMKMRNSKLSDLESDVWLGWDSKNLYISARVADTKLVNANTPEGIASGDVLLLSLCPRTDRQMQLPQLYDYQMQIAPISKDGVPVCRLVNQQQKITVAPSDDPSGIIWKVVTDGAGWTLEAALPFALLAGMVPQADASLACKVSVMDRDNPDPAVNEWKQWNKRIENSSRKDCYEFPYLILGK